MNYSLQTISQILAAICHGCKAESMRINWLLTDSRSLAFPETTLFFALRTTRNDGHRYIDDLYRRGVRAFVVDTLPEAYATRYPEAAFLQVASPLKALQKLAEAHRKHFDVPVIGITGSNGKTIVKEWLYQTLSSQFVITRSPRSYNSQVGVPLSVCLLQPHATLGIFEAGISEPGEMPALARIIQPRIGVMTNIGQAHQENFASLEEKCVEKLALFAHADALIYCADDALVADCIDRTFHGKKVAWSAHDSHAAIYIKVCRQTTTHTQIAFQSVFGDGTFCLPFTDEASVQNACHCLAVGLQLGVPPATLCAKLAQLEAVAMRLEVKQGNRGNILINDSYNSDVNSLDIALDFLQRRPGKNEGQKLLILSDIMQSGMTPDLLYKKVAEMVNHRGIDQLIAVGNSLQKEAVRFDIPSTFFPSTQALLESGMLHTLSDATILIKGARSFNFEAITAALALRVHETTLEVNLEAVVENLNHYRRFMNADTKIVCMVKANAYGAGAIEVAKTLQEHGVDYLAVAVADEGAELRKAGITCHIMVMNPELSAFDTLFAYDLEPEVYSFELLDALRQAAKQQGITNYPVHIKLNTGMHRLGFDPLHDMPALIDKLHRQAALIPASVFSHFVGADSADFNAFSDMQFARFDAASRELTGAFSHKILRHICNSAAIERFPEWHLDMVRLGIGLYGVSPIDNHCIHTVSSLKTTILQIHEVPAGESIGYSRRSMTNRNSRIAAIPIGYADGLNRRLGNRRGYCLVNGQVAPYIGNICMDVAMIDVTNIPCKVGDTVEIFGKKLPVTVLSDLLDTIPYEILTGISTRVKRVYFQ